MAEGKKRNFYRTTEFQALIMGLCAFTAPGLWSAMNNLGAGGGSDVSLINGANAVLYALMTVFCFLGGVFTYKFGFKYSLMFGTIGYPVYAAALYTNIRYGTEWFVWVGACICGITAGTFWACEGAIAMSYPEHKYRGRFASWWFSMRNLGKWIGGAIMLSLNVSSSKAGSVSYETLLVFVVLQCLGLPVAGFLSEPSKVQRRDRSPVSVIRESSLGQELKAIWFYTISKPMLLLSPGFLFYGFVQAYPPTFLATYFSVRARALGAFVGAVVMTLGTIITGLILDNQRMSIKKRTMLGFVWVMTTNAIGWIWGTVVQVEFERNGYVGIDWVDNEFGRGVGAYIFQNLGMAAIENFIYYAIGCLADSPGEMIRYSSVLRGVETAAVALGFGINAIPINLVPSIGINIALWGLSIVPLYFATRVVSSQAVQRLSNQPDGSKETDSSKSSDV